MERSAKCLRPGENRRRPPHDHEPGCLAAARRRGESVMRTNLPPNLEGASFRGAEQRMTRRSVSRFLGIVAAALALPLASTSQVPSGRDVVKPEIYASMEPATRGGSFELAVVMKIRPGFHVNAREKS